MGLEVRSKISYCFSCLIMDDICRPESPACLISFLSLYFSRWLIGSLKFLCRFLSSFSPIRTLLVFTFQMLSYRLLMRIKYTFMLSSWSRNSFKAICLANTMKMCAKSGLLFLHHLFIFIENLNVGKASILWRNL